MMRWYSLYLSVAHNWDDRPCRPYIRQISTSLPFTLVSRCFVLFQCFFFCVFFNGTGVKGQTVLLLFYCSLALFLCVLVGYVYFSLKHQQMAEDVSARQKHPVLSAKWILEAADRVGLVSSVTGKDALWWYASFVLVKYAMRKII